MFLDLEIFRKSPHLSADARQRRCQKRHGHGAIRPLLHSHVIALTAQSIWIGDETTRMVYFSHVIAAPVIVHRPKARLFAAGLSFTMLMCALFPGDSLGRDNAIFQQFTQHIGRQIHKDKQAFAQANTCVSWFYKAGKTPPPTVQGIGWNPTPSSQIEADCLRHYPSGMDDARDDLAKTQALLSVSLTFYRIRLGRRPE